MRLRITILGSGSSGGVPRIGGPDGMGDWGDCDPSEPKNRRRRCSVLIQRADDTLGFDAPRLTTVLVDTSPDMREQLLDARIGHIDGVVMTHDHADQCHGIDDLRAIAIRNRARVPVYLSTDTAPGVLARFQYCFHSSEETGYPAILDRRDLQAGKWVEIDGPTGPIPVLPILLEHGRVPAFGFRFGGQSGEGGIVYSPDTNGVPEGSWPLLASPELWVCDALRYTAHASHAHVDMALEWIARAEAARGILTNLHVDLDYNRLKSELPRGVEPAFDGMIAEAAG